MLRTVWCLVSQSSSSVLLVLLLFPFFLFTTLLRHLIPTSSRPQVTNQYQSTQVSPNHQSHPTNYAFDPTNSPRVLSWKHAPSSYITMNDPDQCLTFFSLSDPFHSYFISIRFTLLVFAGDIFCAYDLLNPSGSASILG